MYKILLVENDATYRERLAQAFIEEHYLVHALSDKLDGIAFFSQNKYDIVIGNAAIDMANGIHFLAMIKQLKSEIKTLMIMDEFTDELLLSALRTDVDFYFSKQTPLPHVMKYLAKVMATPQLTYLERSQILTSRKGKLTVNLSSHEVHKNRIKIELSAKEYQLLVLLLKNKGTGLSRQVIVEELWGSRETHDERLVDKYIKILRDKLQISSIVSIRGYGYKWNE